MASTLATLAKAFWGVCTLRLAPQDIPHSTALLCVTSGANLLLSTVINQLNLSFGSSVLVALLEIVVLFGLTIALLFSFSRTQRAVQTLTALMGAGALIGALVLALLLLFPALPQPARLAIFMWNLLIMAHILRHALETRFIVGFFIAMGYAIFLLQLVVFIDQMLRPAV